MEIKVIGLGGIGGALAPFLVRYLEYSDGERHRVTLVDGDSFERKNAPRQAFAALGNKARVKAEELAAHFPNVSLRAIPEYVTAGNIHRVIREGDVVFLAVDNHKTRKLVSDHCATLQQVLLISGGNELTDGNVQVFHREGRDLTLPLTRFHPEIESPADLSPADEGCEVLLQTSAPQLLFMNLAIASAMLSAFYAWREGRLSYDEVYLDLLLNKSQPVSRSTPLDAPA